MTLPLPRPDSGSHQVARKAAGYDRQLARRFFMVLLIVTGVACVYMVRGFLIPILLAAVFATLFYPLFRRVQRNVGGRRMIASLLTCLVVILGLLLPLWLLATLVAREAVDLYGNAEGQVRDLFARRDTLLADLEQTPWYRALGLQNVDWALRAEEAAQATGGVIASVLDKTSRGTLHLLIVLGVTLFSMIYFFIDGDRIVARLKYLSPLEQRHEEAIVQRFAAVARATVRGTVVIAFIQGALGTILLWACGVTAPILWGVVMTVLAFIPIIGVKLVLLPAGLVQILIGNVWQGVTIIVVSFVVILNVDNLLRPRLVGSGAKMHDLLIFFATLGGLGTFGIAGLIVGPVLAAFFLSLLEIYAVEFQKELEAGGPIAPRGEPGAASEAAQS